MTSASSTHRKKMPLFFGGILVGAACFYAGRFSNHPATSRAKPHVAANAAHLETGARAAADFLNSNFAAQNSTAAKLEATGWNEKNWNDLNSQAGSPARNEALAAMLEQLGATDPDHAMTLAQTEKNLKLRESLVQSALHGWARTSPTNAANWALNLTDATARERAVASVFAGAVATNPDEAVRVGKFVIAQNPDDADGYGSSLIDALCAGGNFEKAAQMATSGGDQTRSSWMGEAYSQWAEFQPAPAAQAAAAIADPDIRNEALHGVVGGWSEADPAALVQFVMQLPADADRSSLLSQSLERWAKEDPAAASQWMNRREPGPDFDQGVAAVATMDSLKPDVALGWAESVVDQKLRSETLVAVLRNWVTSDLPAAKQYFDSTHNLLPEDRQEIADVIAAISGQTATQ